MECALEPPGNALGEVHLFAAPAPDFDVDDFDSERPSIGGQAAGFVRRFGNFSAQSFRTNNAWAASHPCHTFVAKSRSSSVAV
jgi:hypothetical protein